MGRHRVRIRFRKQGLLRWLGHRDVMRCFERWFRRARLPLAMSEGFHPKPRMSFPSALAVGLAGWDEVMEVELAEEIGELELRRRLAAAAPSGWELPAVVVLPAGAGKARAVAFRYAIDVPSNMQAGLAERLPAALASAADAAAQSAEPPASLALVAGRLEMRLAADAPKPYSPREMLSRLGLDALEQQGGTLIRTAVELAG